MKTIRFQDLHKMAFDLHQVYFILHRWKNGECWSTPPEGRPNSGLMFLTHCSFAYLDESGDRIRTIPKGSILYAPQHSHYTCQFLIEPEDTLADDRMESDHLINFTLLDEDGEELCLSEDCMQIPLAEPGYYRDSFQRIAAMEQQGQTPSARIKGILYELLCAMSMEMQKQDLLSREYAAIYPALRRIWEGDLADIDVSTLHTLCYSSPSTFRRLFHAYTGMSPLQYVNHLKIRKATAMLQSGMYTVTETAALLGFSDVYYFSRYYKKQTGHSPKADRM